MVPTNKMKSLDILVNFLYTKYFIESYCITLVSEYSLNVDIGASSWAYINPKNLSNDDLNQLLLYLSEQGCSDYFVQMNEPKDFMRALVVVKSEGIVRRSDGKVVFLPPTTEKENYIEKFLNVLTLEETSNIANLLLVLRDPSAECDVYNFVTHTFVGPKQNAHKPKLIASWNTCEGILNDGFNLFPHDISDMEGRIFDVAAFNYEPYVLQYSENNSTDFDGIEIRLVEEFCRTINCQLQYTFTDNDGEYWGEVYDNGTGTGVLGKMAMGKTDFATAGLALWYEPYKFMDYSTTTIRSNIVCLAPSPRVLTSWKLPLLPFSPKLWGLLLVTYLFASFALTLAQFWSTDKIFLQTFSIFISQTISDNPIWRRRRVTGWLLVMGLLIDNAYNSGLAATLTVPQYEKSIDTIQDIIDTGLEWGATGIAWVFSIQNSDDPKIKQLIRQFRVHDAEVLKQKSFERNMAFGIEKLQAGTFAIGDHITKEAAVDMQIMLERIYYVHCLVTARKSSPYTEKLNTLIGRLHETGLLLAWETDVSLKYADYKLQMEVMQSRNKRGIEVVPLGFQHVLGIFMLYAVGVMLAALMFIYELLFAKYLHYNI